MTVRLVNPGAFGVIERAGEEHARRTCDLIIARGQELISETLRSGVDAAGNVGREDTGAAGQALAQEPARIVGGRVRAELNVSPPADEYWPVVEGGRAPGKRISIEGQRKILVWVTRKIGADRALQLLRGLSSRIASRRLAIAGPGGKLRRITRDDREKALRQLAYLVARKIRRQGTPGLAPFRRAAAKLNGGEAASIARGVAASMRQSGGRP